MTLVVVAVGALLAGMLISGATRGGAIRGGLPSRGAELRTRGRSPAEPFTAEAATLERTRRILFPFLAQALSGRALDAALRLARAEEATLVPVFLARVPLHLPLEAPLPRQAALALPLQEAIEQRAMKFNVPVDARIHRGRTNRHALREAIAEERFDRVVIAAAPDGGDGFGPDDVAWLLEHASGEIVVLRAAAEPREAPAEPQLGRRLSRPDGQDRPLAARKA
jgi:hypothetical protein